MKFYQRVVIESEQDVLEAIQATYSCMRYYTFTKMEKQKMIVSVSELTRNVIDHSKGKGFFLCEMIDKGIRIVISDNGPGIKNVDEVLSKNSVRSVKGMGLGLISVKNLMDDFLIETNEEGGTRIIAEKWTPQTKRQNYIQS